MMVKTTTMTTEKNPAGEKKADENEQEKISAVSLVFLVLRTFIGMNDSSRRRRR